MQCSRGLSSAHCAPSRRAGAARLSERLDVIRIKRIGDAWSRRRRARSRGRGRGIQFVQPWVGPGVHPSHRLHHRDGGAGVGGPKKAGRSADPAARGLAFSPVVGLLAVAVMSPKSPRPLASRGSRVRTVRVAECAQGARSPVRSVRSDSVRPGLVCAPPVRRVHTAVGSGIFRGVICSKGWSMTGARRLWL